MEYYSEKQNINFMCIHHLDKSQEDHAKEKSSYIKECILHDPTGNILKKFK